MIKVGDLVVIPEDAYLYGQGTLTLRIAEVRHTADPAWVQLVGQEIGWDGRRVGPRIVAAKIAAVQPTRERA